MRPSLLAGVAGVLAALVLSGCRFHRVLGPPPIPEEQLPSSMRADGRPQNPAQCQQALAKAAPLLTELPATDKANLEILSRGGAVAVQYTGCSMQVLYNCRLGGRYYWYAVSPTSDSYEINDEDQLYATLPLGAIGLQSDLQRWGKLNVQTSVSGQLRLDGLSPDQIPEDGECARATHIIGALSVGAFVMSTSGGGSAGGGVNAWVLGAGVKFGQGATVVRSAGQPDTCGQTSEQSPPQSCRSPIQAFLWSIPRRPSPPPAVSAGPPQPYQPQPSVQPQPPAQPPPQPLAQQQPPMPPPGFPAGPAAGPPMAARNGIQVDLLSAYANSRWDVYVDDEVICTTPCQRYLDPARPIFLRTREHGFGVAPDELAVPNLFPAAQYGAVQLQARPTSRGQLATGITFTSLGGMAVVTGITLAGVGCSRASAPSADPEDSGMCNAGMISLGVGGLVTAGAIWLMLDSMPKAMVVPLRQYMTAAGFSPSPSP